MVNFPFLAQTENVSAVDHLAEDEMLNAFGS